MKPAPAGMRTLQQNIRKLKLNVAQHAPAHGRVGTNEEFIKLVAPASTARAELMSGGSADPPLTEGAAGLQARRRTTPPERSFPAAAAGLHHACRARRDRASRRLRAAP